jgi:hypothetical protein
MTATVRQDAAKTVPCEQKPVKLLKQVGSTTVVVSVYFSKTSKETFEDKILKLIEREGDEIA